MHPEAIPLCRAALARSKGWAPRPLPAAKMPLPPSQPGGGRAAADAVMQPLPWGDPSLRFSSAPVIDDELATEELQEIPASTTADTEDTVVVQQEEEVCTAHD